MNLIRLRYDTIRTMYFVLQMKCFGAIGSQIPGDGCQPALEDVSPAAGRLAGSSRCQPPRATTGRLPGGARAAGQSLVGTHRSVTRLADRQLASSPLAKWPTWRPEAQRVFYADIGVRFFQPLISHVAYHPPSPARQPTPVRPPRDHGKSFLPAHTIPP